MYPLVETICIRDGIPQNLDWHQWRYENAFCEYFGEKPKGTIGDGIVVPDEFKTGVVKLRILYNHVAKQYEFSPYEYKNIQTLKIVHDNRVDYHLKYSNRQALLDLYNRRNGCDDILIVKNGLVTDSYSANIVFYNGSQWVTSSTPLLKGTCRERLLKRGLISELLICEEDLPKFSHFVLINAMRDFDENQKMGIGNIKR